MIRSLFTGAIIMLTSMVFAQNISNVGVEEFRKLIGSNNGIILDVRTSEEVAGGYIEGASFINYYDPDFKRKIGLMQKDKPVYVYCASGGRSSGAVKTMAQLGFNDLYNLNGGIRAWQAANFPITKSTAKADKNIRSLSLEEFRSKLGGQQLVLVDFHTVWCAPCKKMAPIVDELQNEYKGRAGVLRVDADKSKEVANHYKVVGVPVFILYKSGKAVWRHTGIIGKKELQQIIDQHL